MSSTSEHVDPSADDSEITRLKKRCVQLSKDLNSEKKRRKQQEEEEDREFEDARAEVADYEHEDSRELATPYQAMFGARPFGPVKEIKTGRMLKSHVSKEHVERRAGPGGKTLSYITHNRVCQNTNEAFGYNGWSSTIVGRPAIDIVDLATPPSGVRRYEVSAMVTMRVTLRDGCYHEDIGCASHKSTSIIEATGKAVKSATSDARKRVLRVFGNRLGGSVYDKSFTG